MNSRSYMRFKGIGLITAVIVSLLCHVFCFANIEFTFGKDDSAGDLRFSEVYFLGSILPTFDSFAKLPQETDSYDSRLNNRFFVNTLDLGSSLEYNWPQSVPSSQDVSLVNLTDDKIIYALPVPSLKNKQPHSSVIFYPSMPYHFLLYFKDRQSVHIEVSFYISPKGKVTRMKRKVSSGNPEVDLLVMRNLTHFLNLCKSDLTLGAWQTVKVDLSYLNSNQGMQ